MARGFTAAPGSNPDVERALAADLPRADIIEMSNHKNPLVRENIAARADCPLGAMSGLVHDRKVEVRGALAANPSLPHSLQLFLAQDGKDPVVVALAGNPSLAKDVRDVLVLHRSAEVRSVVLASWPQP